MKEGWTYKKLGEVGSFIRGGGFLKRDFVENGIPCIHYGQIHTILGSVTKEHLTSIPEALRTKTRFASKGDVIFAITSEDVEGSCKCTAWMGDYDVAVGGHAAIYKHRLNPAYVSLFAKSPVFNKAKEEFVHGFKVMEIKPADIAKIEIPVPPLSEQQRIVSRLDAAFSHIDELKANAEKQLSEARALFQKSLAKAMEPKEAWRKYIWGNIIKLQSGDNLPAKKIIVGEYPVYGGNGIAGYHNQYNRVGTNVVVGRVGALCGNVHYVTDPFWLTDNGFEVIVNEAIDVDKKFLSGYLRFLNLGKYARQTAQPVISNASLKDVVLYIPSLSEQKRIVERLDALSAHVRELEENQKKIISECDALKQALLRKVFE